MEAHEIGASGIAWRLGATFVHLALDVEDEAPRQALMRRTGRRLARLMFRPG